MKVALKTYTVQELTVWKLERLIEQKEKYGFLGASDEAELKRCVFLLQHWGIDHPSIKAVKNKQQEKQQDISDKDILDALKKEI
jgi:hypothetical protein